MNIEILDSPEKAIVEKIQNGLRQYNFAQVGEYHKRPIAVISNESEQIIAGAYGWIIFNWLYIDLLWVAEKYRHQGMGKKLLFAVEQAAKERHIFNIHLNTASWQAIAFYQKQGYEIFAQLDMATEKGAPFINYFLKKTLR